MVRDRPLTPRQPPAADQTLRRPVGPTAPLQPTRAPSRARSRSSGAPNVGKSTLLNQIVGEKLAIVSPRAQTTRNRIVGVWTGQLARRAAGQIVFVDTPGMHDPRSALGRFMVQEASPPWSDIDAILLVVDAQG